MQFTHTLLKALAIACISAAALAQTALPYTDGEVRKVDLSAQKITLKHGEIKNLEMPPMSMVFQVKNPALLEKIKAGDKVKFTAEQIGSALVVTDIQPAP
ncbi:Cu and Ag efflux protein CusF [Rhodoferax sp. OV413]|uniref:copper-binding protein n=1 Tax=Rhodoferax sp. OV413 TaxID=1855285 RepID=UPI00087EFA73|nr:copper-binding protein [Rhodoferax sp. OV413]SDN93204.1 Cu and Ag efflux protein CusF [Rhodoferax sp. OV413]